MTFRYEPCDRRLRGAGRRSFSPCSRIIPASSAIARAPRMRDPWFLDADAMPKLREEMQRLIDRRGRFL